MNETATPPDDWAEAYLTLPTPNRVLKKSVHIFLAFMGDSYRLAHP